MMRRQASGVRLQAALLLVAAACARPQLVAGPPVDAEALWAQVQAAHQKPDTLSCDGKAIVEAPDNSGRYALHVLVQRPASIRLEALTPLGDPAAVLVASEGRFALLDLRNNVYYRGPATPQNLSRLIPAPLTAAQLVSILTGAPPEGGAPQSAHRLGDGYRLALAEEVVDLGADLRVTRVERDGWTVALDDHDAGVPHRIHLDAPRGQTSVDLRLRNVQAGNPPPATAFQLPVPQGVKIEEVP